MNWSITAVVLGVSLISGFAHSLSGFGYGIVMMAVLPLVISASTSVVLSLIGCLCFSTWTVFSNRAYLNFKPIFWTSLFSTLSGFVGLLVEAQVSPSLYLRILGLFFIALALWMWRFSDKATLPDTPFVGALAGLINGVLGALFAVGGPTLGLYFNASTPDKRTYMASLQCAISVQSIITLLMRVSMGLWPTDVWRYLAALLLGTVAGIIPGKIIFNHLSSNGFRKFIYGFMCAAGFFMVLTA